MPKALVRHGLVTYTRTDPLSGRDYEDRAFRGMTIEIEKQPEYDRLLRLQAIVRPGTELDLPGRLRALPDTATDEEILNWALAATPTEIEEQVRLRPILAARLKAAGEAAKTRLEAYNKHMGGISEAAERGAEASERAAKETAERAAVPTPPAPVPAVPPGASVPSTTGGDPSPIKTRTAPPPPANANGGTREGGAAGDAGDGTGTGEVADDEYYDQIIARNAKETADWVASNPDHFNGVLEAENRRAAIRGDQPRSTVVKACEIAAAHQG